MNISSLTGAIALAVVAASAQAATVTFSDSAQIDTLDFDDLALDIVAFNPDFGTLNAVTLMFSAVVTISAGIENEGPADGSFALSMGSTLDVTASGSALASAEVFPLRTLTFDLDGYDGTTDFGGSSGVSVEGEMISALGQNTLTDAATLAALTGTDPLRFDVSSLPQVEGQSTSRFGQAPITSFVGETYVALDVTYTFTAPPVAAVPLPAGLPLLGLGLLGLGLIRRRA